MTWLLSVVLGALPDLWIVAALAAAALYIFAWWQPGRLSAEVVRLGALCLLGLAVYLWTFASATAAYDARVRAAVEAERARVAAAVADSLTEARAEAAAASAARIAAEKRLEDAMAAVPEPPPDDPAKPLGGGLSPASAEALLKAIGG